MTDLTFKKLRAVNYLRQQRWLTGGVDTWTPSDWGLAMAGEAGEACNAIKKLNRLRGKIASNNNPRTEARAIRDVGDELADVIVYADLLAQRLGIDLEEAVVRKFNAISKREAFPERL